MLPPSLTSPTGSTCHPEFMFCGNCTKCHEADTAAGPSEDKKTDQIYFDDLLTSISHRQIQDSNNSDKEEFATDGSTIQTTFCLRQSITKVSRKLVIQSLLTPFRC
jgi:hypothetical protein